MFYKKKLLEKEKELIRFHEEVEEKRRQLKFDIDDVLSYGNSKSNELLLKSVKEWKVTDLNKNEPVASAWNSDTTLIQSKSINLDDHPMKKTISEYLSILNNELYKDDLLEAMTESEGTKLETSSNATYTIGAPGDRDDFEEEPAEEMKVEDHKSEGGDSVVSKTFSPLNREKKNQNFKTYSRGQSSINTTSIGQVLPGKVVKQKLENVHKETDGIPESLRMAGQDTIMKFLKAKVKYLTEQLELVQKDDKKHLDKIKDLQNDRERVAEDRDKWIQQANIAKNVLVKHEQHSSTVIVQLQGLQSENGHLKKEIEKLKKELKQVNQNSGSNEVRLNRAIEEIEKLKSTLKQVKQEEKDFKESNRKKTEDLSGAVRRLDKQRVELLHAFKKQLIMIDNLKKQRGLVEAGKVLKSTEDDFMEFLDWNPNKN